MERAGIDVVTDGEIRRESYSNRFATALDGRRPRQPGTSRSTAPATPNPVPRVVGPIRRPRSGRGARRRVPARQHRTGAIKITVPGPFTMSQQAQDDYYGDAAELALAYAAAVNEELRDLVAAGADVVQIDEPYLQARPEQAREYALAGDRPGARGDRGRRRRCTSASATRRSSTAGRPRLLVPGRARRLRGDADLDRGGPAAARPSASSRSSPSKDVILGVLDLGDPDVESREAVAERIRAALEHVDRRAARRSRPDCGMKYLPRATAYRQAPRDGRRPRRSSARSWPRRRRSYSGLPSSMLA